MCQQKNYRQRVRQKPMFWHPVRNSDQQRSVRQHIHQQRAHRMQVYQQNVYRQRVRQKQVCRRPIRMRIGIKMRQ